jgi:hypothetical protein
LATAAQALTFTPAELPDLKVSLLVHAAGGLVILLVATVLAIYKPAGITPRGLRFLDRTHHNTASLSAGVPRWIKSFAVAGLLLILLAILALFHGGHGPGVHVLHG